MSRLIVQDKIADLLAIFSAKLSILSSNNEYSWNSLAENIFIPLLNHTLNCKFVNENIESLTKVPAIDLVDRKKRVTIQITSSGNYAKIKSTIEKFFNSSLEDEFDILYFFILKDKKGFNITVDQEEQLSEIIQERISFNSNKNILDFSKLYLLLNDTSIDELNELNSNLEKELGILSTHLIKNSPAVTVLFDETEVELAFKIVKGLLERDLRIRYFSHKLMNLLKERGIQSDYCQRLYDVSSESRATLILSTKNYVENIEQKKILDCEMQMLKNQHLKHILIKFDDQSSFSHFDWISPIIRKGIKHDLNSTINFASNELHRINKVIEIQDYEDFETIIKLHDSKQTFSKIEKYRDSKKNIAYQILPAFNELYKVTTYFLFIPKGCSLSTTAKFFYDKKPELKLKRESIILVIPKERNQKFLEERLKNAEKAFKPKSAYYLDEFISKFCTNGQYENNLSVRFSSTNNFVQPELTAIEGELSDFDQIENWIVAEYDPLLIITGGGGIGKTTLAREIADLYSQINTNARIVLIEASNPSVINRLARISDTGKIDLYDFYSSIEAGTKISRDLFRVTLDNGNLMLIIDGLDEVFSRIPDFDVDYFINSVSNNFVQQIGVGKVLITCRTYFWKEQISKENSINHFKIEPFSLDHARSFFKKKLKDPSEVKKAIEILQEMDIEKKGEERFLPFIVDVVGEIVESKSEILDGVEEIELKYLNLKKQIDFIVYRVLYRENIKINVDINSQMEFLIHLAIFYKGQIKRSEIEALRKTKFSFMLDDRRLESLQSHPFINVINSNISFKYDFFELYFKSLYLTEFISLECDEKMSEAVINILLHEGKFGSSLFFEISKRNEISWNDDNVLRIVDLIEEVNYIDVSNFKDQFKIKHQVKSSLFALALMINQSKYNNQTITNTKLLKLMFGINNTIKEVSLVNFGILEGNIRFNFSDLEFENCYFDSYDPFWECKFNQNTMFKDCTFYNMSDFSRLYSTGLSINKFINPKYDNTFEKYFIAKEQSSASKRKKISHSFAKYLRLFYSNGSIRDKDNKSTIHSKYNSKDKSNLPLEVIERVLIESKHLKIEFDRVRGENVASIDYEFREDVFKFLQEGVESYKMKKVIDSMLLHL